MWLACLLVVPAPLLHLHSAAVASFEKSLLDMFSQHFNLLYPIIALQSEQ